MRLKLYLKCVCVCAYFLQVRKVSPVFKLQPSSIYLVKEFDNVAVFLHELSGRFNHSLINPTATYEVNGEAMEQTGNDSAVPPSTVTPFGAFTGPTVNLPPHFQLVHRKKTSTCRKTMALISLSVPSSSKPTFKASCRLDYKVITQVVVTTEMGHCSPKVVADLVRQQLSFGSQIRRFWQPQTHSIQH